MAIARRFALAIIAVALVGVGCGCRQAAPPEQFVPAQPQLARRVNAQMADLSRAFPVAAPSARVPVPAISLRIFRPDSQCQTLVALPARFPARLPRQRLATLVLERAIAEQRLAYFELARTRLTLQRGIATVDLTVSPTSLRGVTSLSSCEQFALFRSIKASLTQNPTLAVREVRFTQSGGRQIYL